MELPGGIQVMSGSGAKVMVWWFRDHSGSVG